MWIEQEHTFAKLVAQHPKAGWKK